MIHFNRNNLLESISNNEEFLKDLMLVSSRSLKKYYASFCEAVKTGDIESISIYAHSIKGMAVSMHFVRLADLAKNIEYKSKNCSYSELMELIPDFNSEVEYLFNNVLNNY
jgi:HPt (histidine-containing phosphotransfer) domain-containing protein